MSNPAYAPLAYPAFRAFLVGRVFSTLARQILSVAVGWQIYDLTGDPLDLGLVGLVQFLPHLFLFPVAGAVVDRADRRRVIQSCYVAFAAVSLLLCALAAPGMASPGRIFGALVLLALARMFNGPAGSATLPRLVPIDIYPRAVSWNSSAFTGATVAGPALGGLLYGLAAARGYNGAQVSYALAFVLSALAAVSALQLPPARAAHPGHPPSFAEALVGLRYIWRRKVLFEAILLDLFAVLFGGAIALLPVYARDVLHAGPEGLGLLRAAPAVGSLLVAISLAHYPVTRRLGPVLFGAVAVFGAATLVFALSTELWLSAMALALAGAADEVSVFIRINVVQMATPDHLRGRVSAAEFLFIGASNELGEMESGLTAAWWGAVPAAVVGGAGTLVVVVCALLFSRELRKVDRLSDLAAEAESRH